MPTQPLPFETADRFAHTHVIGSTNSGKTTLLQNLIAHDLKSDASIIVLDPHRVLVPQLSRLKLDRNVVLIDAKSAPSINIFDVKDTDDEDEKRRVLAYVRTMLDYIIGEASLDTTPKQSNVLTHLARLMISRSKKHGPQTLRDLYDFLHDPAPFMADIAEQPYVAQKFFEKFVAKTTEFRNTAGEIIYRLDPILSEPLYERIFSSPKTMLDLAKEIDSGSLILIDANPTDIGPMANTFGKVFLAFILEAARKTRDPLKPEDHWPVFLYVDECHHFMDEKAQELLVDARKLSLGCIFSHQDMSEITSATVRSALKGTAFKFAGGVIAEDARALAPDMRTTPEFILGLPSFHFAAYVKGKTPVAVSILPTLNPLADLPTLSEAEYQSFLVSNRERLSYRGPPKSPPPSPPQSPPPSGGMTDVD